MDSCSPHGRFVGWVTGLGVLPTLIANHRDVPCSHTKYKLLHLITCRLTQLNCHGAFNSDGSARVYRSMWVQSSLTCVREMFFVAKNSAQLLVYPDCFKAVIMTCIVYIGTRWVFLLSLCGCYHMLVFLWPDIFSIFFLSYATSYGVTCGSLVISVFDPAFWLSTIPI